MNPLLISGVALNLLAAFGFAQAQDGTPAAIVIGLFSTVQLAGLIMMALGRQRSGAELAFWGSILMLPLGVLTTLGARRAIDETILQDFQTSRASA